MAYTGYRPVGIDDEGNLPPRARQAIAESAEVVTAIAGVVPAAVERSAPDAVAAKARPSVARTAVPLVVFMDDDGRAPAWSVLRPLFAAQGVKASFAITTDLIDSANHMSWDQVRALRDEGHEIVNHSKTHASLATADAAQAASEIVAALAKFHAEGIYPEGFAYAQSTSNALARAVVRNTHRYGLGGIGGGGGTRVPIWSYAIGRTLVNAASVLGDLTAMVDQYIANPGILVFFTHSTDVSAATINALIDYVQAAGVEIVTSGEAAARYANVLDMGDAPAGSWLGIDALGKTYGFDGLVRQTSSSAQTTAAAAAPSTFPAGVVDVRSISNSQTDWPTPSQPGTVTTNRLVTSHWPYTVQQFIDNQGRIFTRRAVDANTWGAWNSSDSKLTIGGTYTLASTYDVYNVGITIGYFTGGPGLGEGVLTTYRSNSGAVWHHYQTFSERNGGPTWRRTPVNGGGWSAWKVGIESSSGTTAPSSTPKFVGEQYVDTFAKKVYVATGTAGSSDWTVLN
ncbi:MAG: hypothetical protein K0S70_2436 [Microbacterium sp.]|nr:hypothetical protein [Microbacterium sp.]